MADNLGALVAKLAADVTDLKKGLQQGRQEFTSFQNLIETGAAQVRKVLAFAGISLGLYALASEVKAFGASILETGQKSEVLRGAMYAIGQHYNISSAALDLYINKLTQMGVSQENALQSVNNFLKAGLSVDLLPQLAAAAKDLAPTMAMPFNEAFSSIIEAVTKGTPKALAELTPGLRQAVMAASSETQKIMDSTILSGTEKAQIMVDLVLAAGEKVKGAGDSMIGTYLKQANDYKKAVREVKEALFEIVKPISMAITGSEIESWQDLYVWIVKNKEALKETATEIANFIQKIAGAAKDIGGFILQHKELIKILLEVYVLSKAAGWFIGVISGITTATTAVSGLLVRLGLLQAAIAGPWGIVVAITLVGVANAYQQIKDIQKQTQAIGKTIEDANLKDRAFKKWQAGEKLSPEELAIITTKGQKAAVAAAPKISEEDARIQIKAAAAKGAAENALPPGAGKGGGKGASAKETTDNLLGPLLAMYKTKREAELQDAQNSLDLLKTTNDQKRAVLEKDLVEGLIDGQTYYQSLQDLQQQETTAAIAMIARKREAQKKAYQESITEVESDKKLSDEAKSIALQKLAAENRKALAKLDTEATQAKLEGEIKVTNELKRQVEVKKQYMETTENLNVDTAQLLGAISEQEATLMRLNLEWKRNKQAALDAGLSPSDSFFTAGEKNLEAKKADTLYGGYASKITQGISDITDALIAGGEDLKKAANNVFKGLFDEAMKPGLDQLKGLLVSGFKSIFGDAGTAISSAVMGVIGLVGMLLTSSKSESNWTASSIESSVTSHEAVRGVIAGETTVAISEVDASLKDALTETNEILTSIELNTRSGGGGGGSSVNVSIEGIQEAVYQALDSYFSTGLQLGKV